MSVFTDEQLKRLKESADDPNGADMFAVDVLHLLARLECAERVCQVLRKVLVNQAPGTDLDLPLIAWMESCGSINTIDADSRLIGGRDDGETSGRL